MAIDVKNWAKHHTFGAHAVHFPSTVEEVQDLVRSSTSVKALGTKHSFNDIADSPVDLISTERLNQIIDVDRERMTVTVEGGITYGTLSKHLYLEGFALHNLASLPHISVAGACATATHGSGIRNGNLSTAVTGLELVSGTGDVVGLTESDPDFAGSVVNLGALGIVTSMTLRMLPAFSVRQYVYQSLPFEALESHFDEIMGKAYSVSLFTTWTSNLVDQVWLKDTDIDRTMPSTWFGANLSPVKLHPLPNHPADFCTEQLGQVGSWHERLAHFKMEFTPSSGEELQSEYIVPRQHAFQALSTINQLRDMISPVLHVSEIRTVAKDDLWLSSSYGTDSVCIHFTWKKNWPVVRTLLPVIEEALRPFDARPHWGKLYAMGAERITSLYPQMADFKNLASRYDPERKFRNSYLTDKVYD